MFNDSKYTKWYYQIIDRERTRAIVGENHHIIPKSMGGLDTKDNLIDLTTREHYLCHYLLTKMIDDPLVKEPLIFALWAMSNQKGSYRPNRSYRVPSRLYAKLREQIPALLSKINTGRKYPNRKKPVYSEEEKERQRERARALGHATKGRKLSTETKDKIKEARALQDMSHMKKPCADETKAKISATLKGNIPWNKGLKGPEVSAETRAKLSAAKSNPSAETRAKLSAAAKKQWALKKNPR